MLARSERNGCRLYSIGPPLALRQRPDERAMPAPTQQKSAEGDLGGKRGVRLGADAGC
jgi:hypothetical protein